MSAFDPVVARRCIEATYPPGVAGLLSISYIDPDGGFQPGRQFTRSDIDGLLRYATALDASGAPSIYLRNCTVRLGVVGRGTAADSVELLGVFHDVDYGTVGHSAKNNPPDTESAWKIVVKSGLPEPTMVIDSGGGLYPRWLFPHPVNIESVGFEAADLLIKKYHAALQNAAHDLGWDFGDECKDLATVMRLPGSRNRKNGTDRPCRILSDNGPRYSFDELCEAVTHIEVACVSTRAGTSAEVEALFARLTDPHGDACDWMKATLDRAVGEVEAAGGSCRDVALKKAAAIARGAPKDIGEPALPWRNYAMRSLPTACRALPPGKRTAPRKTSGTATPVQSNPAHGPKPRRMRSPKRATVRAKKRSAGAGYGHTWTPT